MKYSSDYPDLRQGFSLNTRQGSTSVKVQAPLPLLRAALRYRQPRWTEIRSGNHLGPSLTRLRFPGAAIEAYGAGNRRDKRGKPRGPVPPAAASAPADSS